MPVVTLKNVSISQGDLAPGRGLNLEIRDREFVVLAGPPSSGISTVLRMIAGLEFAPGDVLLGERRLNDISPKDRDVAFVSKDFAPYPRMSVFDNLAFGLQCRKFPKTETQKRVRAVAEIMGLQGLLQREARSVSAEELQWVALARGMVLQPKVFLFDEPFATLETQAQRRGRAEVKKLHQRLPATIIYATHDPMEAMAMGARMVIINNGTVEQDGNAQSIYEEPANLFAAGFVGDPAMNLIQGALKQDRDSLLFSEAGDGTIELRLSNSRFAQAAPFAGQAVVLGIRPEDLEVSSSATGAGRSPTSFPALVDEVERKGPATDLHLQTGAHALICRSQRKVDSSEGGYRAQFEVNLAKAHLFDPSSGIRITQE